MTETVELGAAFNFAILATTTVTSVGNTIVDGGNINFWGLHRHNRCQC